MYTVEYPRKKQVGNTITLADISAAALHSLVRSLLVVFSFEVFWLTECFNAGM